MSGVHVLRDIPYLGAGRRETLDLYRSLGADPAEPLPGIVIIHGGGFFALSKSDDRERSIAQDLARWGSVCVSIDYRLVDFEASPEAGRIWPVNLHDCKRAIRFLRDRGRRYGVDPDRIGVVGSSAGGHLAAMLGCTAGIEDLNPPEARDPSLYGVQAVVCLYGVFDLAGWLRRSARHVRGMDAIARMMGGTADELPDAYRKASPVCYASPSNPPILMIHGSADDVVPWGESERFARTLEDAGAECELVIVPGAPHSFDLHPPQQDLAALVIAFFEKHLRAP